MVAIRAGTLRRAELQSVIIDKIATLCFNRTMSLLPPVCVTALTVSVDLEIIPRNPFTPFRFKPKLHYMDLLSCLLVVLSVGLFVCVCLFACLWDCYHDNSKLRGSIVTKLGL